MEEKNKKSKHGGSRKGAGAPKKETSDQAKEIMKKALRVLYNKGEDIEAAQISFLKDFAQTPRGQQFVAEHLFGKAPQVIEQEGSMVLQTPTIKFVSADNDK